MWKNLRWIWLAIFSFITVSATAQETDNTNAYRNLYGKEFIRLGGDDDWFNNTDEEYTEGINMELIQPWVKNFPFSSLLICPAGFANVTYGLGIEHAGYTPRDIKIEFEPNTGRPFASFLLLKTFLFAEDPYWKQTFSASFYAGVIGRAGLGEWIQDNAHALVHQVQPPGWRYQIHNDLAINYQVNYEKQLLSYGAAALSATTMARAGTLNDALSPGVNLLIGKTSQYAKPAANPPVLRAYIYDHPYANFVFYDASLEGGMFVRDNPYTILPDNINHIALTNRTGVVLAYDDLNLELYHVYTSPEYKTGPYHNWDGVQLSILLAEKSSKHRP